MTEERGGLPIVTFDDVTSLEHWLASQPDNSSGCWIKLAKKGSGVVSISKSEVIDTALCHGWIDGQLDKYDEFYWLVRLTPRKPHSKWSAVNRERVAKLLDDGKMRPRGLAEVDKAKADGRWNAAYAPASTAAVPADLQAALDRSPFAASFFATLTGANRYAILYRIGAVKRPETRARKIAEFVAMLERHETVHG